MPCGNARNLAVTDREIVGNAWYRREHAADQAARQRVERHIHPDVIVIAEVIDQVGNQRKCPEREWEWNDHRVDRMTKYLCRCFHNNSLLKGWPLAFVLSGSAGQGEIVRTARILYPLNVRLL